jgi:hopanoid biosynthesis associated protein HpnK
MRRFLIITADDFGIHEAVNEAVTVAASAGVLTAASLMVGGPAARDAIRRARELPQLRVGLHLVLADGHAVLTREQIPDLVDAQGRFGQGMWLDGVRYFGLPRVRRQLEAEIRAQFVAFARTGLVLDHVNAHKHFHLHPTLLSMIVRIGREFGMSAVRVPHEPIWYAGRGGNASAMLASAFLTPWVALMKARLHGARLLHNDQVFGIAGTGQLDEAMLLEILAKLPHGVTEIYLHPAIDTHGPITASMSDYRHSAELAALLSKKVADAVAATAAGRGGYRDLPEYSRRARVRSA